MVYIFSFLFLSPLFSICHVLPKSINYLPVKAYGHSVRLFIMLQLLILLLLFFLNAPCFHFKYYIRPHFEC